MSWADQEEQQSIHDDVRICVDVGGIVFHTTVKTLKKSSYFEDNITGQIIEAQYIFVDRDPYLFNYILTYFRSGILPYCEDKYLYETLKEELKFFGLKDAEKELFYVKTDKINDLAHEIKQMKQNLHKNNQPRTRSQEWNY